MHLNQWMTCFTTSLVLAGHSVFAGSMPLNEQLQIPQCLASQLTSDHKVLAQNKDFQIVEMPSRDVNSLALLADKVKCGHFVNVSHKLVHSSLQSKKHSAVQLLHKNPISKSLVQKDTSEVYEIRHQKEVNEALTQVDSNNIWQTLTRLTSFHNRSATKKTGVETAEWLKAQFKAMVTESGRTDTDAYFVETGWYKQPSLVTVIGKHLKGPAVVIGAHMDTLDGRMPGAGDDGSGTSSVMEAARVLLASKSALKHPVYIIWYAAEERGLVGSQYVVEHFMDKSIPVKAVAQFDMTGYRVNPVDPTMWVYTDYTHKGLSAYTAKLIETYVHAPVDYSKCGYGCSDHASWTEEGIPAVFPCESNFEEHNPFIHTSSDTMDLISLEHMTNFTKLALAFVIELASE